MPLYEYKCSSCDHCDEILESMNAENPKACPKCNKNTFSRQVSATNFQLKGSGWYVTDFKDKNKDNSGNN